MYKSLAFLLFVAGCGGAESTNDLLGRRANQPGPSGAVAGTEPAPADETSATADADGGSLAPANNQTSDAGTSAPPPSDPFTGASAYVAQTGPSTIKGEHPFPGGNPAKQGCLQSQCHGVGGEGPRFIAGGSVFKDVAGTSAAAQIEVRIRDANGDARIARTDVNGNFYFLAGNNVVDFPARTGARDGATTRNMAGSIANGDCNSSTCHGGTQGVIHVP
jgi:hypothetical protein